MQAPKEPVTTTEEIADWAFVVVMAKHLRTCLQEGRFSQIQEMIKQQGFTVGLYNPKKKRQAKKG